MKDLPDLMTLWDYDHPAQSEKRFRAVLPRAQAAANTTYLLELKTQIARSLALQRQFDAANALLDEVAPQLTEGRPRAHIRYLLERGRTLNSMGQTDEGLPLFLEAWEIARKAHEDGLAVDAAHMVAIAIAPTETLKWNLTALELAQTSADPDARRWLGSLYNNIGWTYYAQDDFDRAIEMFSRALEQCEAQGTPQEIRVAKWCVAKTRRSLGDVAIALAMQMALAAEIEADGAAPDGYVLEELAECYRALGDPAARDYFGRAYDILAHEAWLADNEPDRIERLKRLAGRA